MEVLFVPKRGKMPCPISFVIFLKGNLIALWDVKERIFYRIDSRSLPRIRGPPQITL